MFQALWERQKEDRQQETTTLNKMSLRLPIDRLQLNSTADCNNTDLPLTQRKWPLSTTLGMAWGVAWDTATENTTDNCWLNVCQDMGGRKMCPWHLKQFWIEHDLFWQSVLYHWHLGDRHRGGHPHTVQHKRVVFKERSGVLESRIRSDTNKRRFYTRGLAVMITRPSQVSLWCVHLYYHYQANKKTAVTQRHYFLHSLRCNAGLLDP